MACVFVFYKQRTAYDTRFRDWSSDVCSSDLGQQAGKPFPRPARIAGDDDLLLCPLERGDMLAHRLIDIGVLRPLRREVAGAIHCEVEDGGALRFMEGVVACIGPSGGKGGHSSASR